MRFILILLNFITFITLSNVSFAEDIKFHPPHTEAEKALDKIIYINNHNRDIRRFIWKHPERNLTKDKQFENLFTKELQNSWAKGYRESPLGDDGIHHQVSFGFLMCGHGDYSESYRYATVKKKKNTYYIATVPIEDSNINPSRVSSPFKMKLEDGVWKLDGVKCMDVPYMNTDFNYSN